jgi:hypothetical protein
VAEGCVCLLRVREVVVVCVCGGGGAA